MQDLSVLYWSRVCLIPGFGHKAHTHDYWHFTVVLYGASRKKDGSVTSSSPRCLCSPPGVVSDYSICDQTHCAINVMFVVHNKSLYRNLEVFPFESLGEEEMHIPVLTSILEQAYNLNPNQEFIDCAFAYYLQLLLATHQHLNETAHQPVSLIEKALSYIEENYMQQIRLEDVANHIGRTTYYTSHLFQSATGTTMVEHLKEIRIKNACKQLAYSDTPIEKIISECGFISASYFHRVFREKMGTTPNRYRTSHVVRDTFYLGEDAALDVPYNEPVYTYIPGARKCIQWKTPRDYFNQEDNDAKKNEPNQKN